MVSVVSELNIKGAPVSGRRWKAKALPKRAMIKGDARNVSKEKIRELWQINQKRKEEAKQVALEARELVERDRELKKLKRQRLKRKREMQQENEIRSAGNNIVLVSSKKVAKMSKKAKKQLTKLTPETFERIVKRK